MDYTGHHVIVALVNGDGYYLYSRSNKPKKLSKLHGVIESVAFDRIRVPSPPPLPTPPLTRDIRQLNQILNHFLSELLQVCHLTCSLFLISCVGRIYEVSFESNGKEKLFQQVFQIDSANPIISIYFETWMNPTPNESTPSVTPSPSSGITSGLTSGLSNTIGGIVSGGASASNTTGDNEDPSNRIFVMCSTKNTPVTRLYNFIGGPTFSQLFLDYKASGRFEFD